MNSPFFDSNQLKLFMSSMNRHINTEESDLILAKICSFIAHGGQFDKEKESYYKHPLRVSEMVKTKNEKIVALLHDVIEDSKITVKNLRDMGFSAEIVEAVKTLTKGKLQSYEKYLIQVSMNQLAKSVKLADIQDNLDPKRLNKLSIPLQRRLRKKYERALVILNNKPDSDL